MSFWRGKKSIIDTKMMANSEKRKELRLEKAEAREDKNEEEIARLAGEITLANAELEELNQQLIEFASVIC